MHALSAFRPLEPGELAKEAETFEFNPLIPLRHYVGALDTLYREGRNYLRERNFAKAYLLLFRFSILYIDKVSKLAEAQTPAGRRLLKPTQRRMKDVLAELENIKPDLVEARRRWDDAHREAPLSPNDASYGSTGFAARDAALSWNAKAQATLLDASQHQDFAVDLATEELDRRREASLDSESELRRQMQQARHQLDLRADSEAAATHWANSDDQRDQPVPVTYHYPSISKPAPLRYDEPVLRPSRPSSQAFDDPPPVRPPKPATSPASRYEAIAAPPVPPRRELASSHRSDLAGLSPMAGVAAPQRPPKTVESAPAPEKESYTFRPAGYLENGTPIRPIFLPEGLRKDFVHLAADNTRRGIETCGILCGTNINNALFITCLLIPEQHGTPDTCETTNEAATFEFFDKEDLLQIGWIHTHPTQTCFMSSRDLHTQAGYQIMMDESIAIVCSPRHDPSWGVFRLTKPPGLQHLLNCNKTDTFHQHDLPPEALYIDAQNPPGHVFVTSRMNYRKHDLRQKA